MTSLDIERKNKLEKPLNIGFLIGQLGLGGAEKQVYLIASALKTMSANPVVLTFDSSGSWAEALEASKITVVTIQRRKSLEIGRVIQLRNELIRLQLPIVFCLGPAESFYGRLSVVGLDIKAIPNLRSQDWGSSLNFWSDRLMKYGTHHYIANSKVGAQFLQKKVGVPIKKITWIGNAVELTEEADWPKHLQDPRPKNFPVNSLWCGWVGSFTKLKDPGLLVDICAITSQSIPELHYLVVGDGPLRSEIETEVVSRHLSHWIHFTGVIENGDSVWQYLDFGLSTSRVEGTPNVLLEAMRSGKPYIAPPIGDFRYWIDNYQNGIISTSRSAEDLSKCIKEISHNNLLRLKLSQNAKQIINQIPTPQEVALSYLNLAKRLIVVS